MNARDAGMFWKDMKTNLENWKHGRYELFTKERDFSESQEFKTTVPFWITLAILFLLIPTLAQAQFTYTTNGGTVTITSYTGSAADVSIPSIINNLQVTDIGQGSFAGLSQITNITIPNTVLRIRPGAFQGCTNLINAGLGNSVTNIGDDAFDGCSQLSSVVIPDSVCGMQDAAFQGCLCLTNISIGNHVRIIGNYTFTWCTNLAKTTIGNTVASIGTNAFAYCTSLSSITLPDSVTNIGPCAFMECESLTSVVIPNKVTSVADGTFASCIKLTNVTIGDTVASIGDSAFYYDASLSTPLRIPNTVTNIGRWAFAWCTNLTSVFFLGDSPSGGISAFLGDTDAIAYFLPGTAGWDTGYSYGGLTTVLLSGSLQVAITPDGALNSGAMWNIDGGGWERSDSMVLDLTLGSHTVNFSNVAGWTTPPSQIVIIDQNQTTTATGTYSVQQHAATATPVIANGFLVGVTLGDLGYGYSNAPTVYIVGGGGSVAQASATISNGVVWAITIISPGSGYTSIPTIVINPPGPQRLDITEATCLSFTNLVLSKNYQCQEFQGGIWTNVGTNFVPGGTAYSKYAAGSATPSSYRLVMLPIPPGAAATAQVSYGFFVGAIITSGGSGYTVYPVVTITGGGGSGAQATATVSNGVVTAINVIHTGTGYTSLPDVQIDAPTIQPLLPIATKAVRIDCSGLTVNLNYQLQTSQDLNTWTNFGSTFTTATSTNSPYLNVGTGRQFFRLQYLP